MMESFLDAAHAGQVMAVMEITAKLVFTKANGMTERRHSEKNTVVPPEKMMHCNFVHETASLLRAPSLCPDPSKLSHACSPVIQTAHCAITGKDPQK